MSSFYYICPPTTIYLSPYYYISVLIRQYASPHATIYVSSCYCIGGLTPPSSSKCPHSRRQLLDTPPPPPPPHPPRLSPLHHKKHKHKHQSARAEAVRGLECAGMLRQKKLKKNLFTRAYVAFRFPSAARGAECAGMLRQLSLARARSCLNRALIEP